MHKELVAIKTVIPDIILDLRYSQANNICKRPISNLTQAYLRTEPFKALQSAAKDFSLIGYRIKIWDAYRTPQTQKQIQKICSDTNYVAEVSNHSRGTAIDMTLIDNNGHELDMGSNFDDFSKRSHSNNQNVTKLQKKNRDLLESVMTRSGFKQLATEWWHFDYITDTLTQVIYIDEVLEYV